MKILNGNLILNGKIEWRKLKYYKFFQKVIDFFYRTNEVDILDKRILIKIHNYYKIIKKLILGLKILEVIIL